MTDKESVPEHVGIILDGNRRWAKQQGLPTLEGHRRGSENFKSIAMYAFGRGVKVMSAYVFSTENWQRTDEEVGYLMGLILKGVEAYLDEFNQHGIRIVILGKKDGLRKNVHEAIEKAEALTRDNTNGTLALCLNYGGQQEIADAASSLAKAGRVITPESLSESLYSPDIKPVDLIIRTSGEQRLSGFMLWRSAYAELFFSPVLWPDFTSDEFDRALEEYANRQRRFGH